MALTAAERQARRRQKLAARGFRQKQVWIRDEDYQAGYRAAQIGAATMSDEPPPGVHRTSWVLGWLDWIEKRDRAIKRAALKNGKK